MGIEMNETQFKPLGISKHSNLKGMGRSLLFSDGAVLAYWKENYLPGQAICSAKICEISLAKIPPEDVISDEIPFKKASL